MTRKIMIVIGIIGILGLAGCGSGSSGSLPGWAQSSGTGEVVASINGNKIFLSDYKERMEKQSPYIRARYNALDKKKEFLDNLVRGELLAQAAIKKGYDKDPEVIQSAKQMMTQKLMREEFDKKLKPEDIPDSEVQKYYEEHKSEYNKPAMIRASHILVKVAPEAKESEWNQARQKAQTILKEAMAGKDDPNSFRKLAADSSDDEANKTRGGDLGYFASTDEGGPMAKEFSDAAFAIKEVNDIVGLVKTKFGFHIVRLTGKRDKIERTFDQVKSQIQHKLYKDKRTKMFDDYVEDLKKNAKIEINDTALNAYQVPGGSDEPGPAGTPGMPGMPPNPHGMGGPAAPGGQPGQPPALPPGHPTIPAAPAAPGGAK